MGSQATRDSDGVVFTAPGLEIGVAATKTFVAQVAVMYLLGSSWPRCATRSSPRSSAASATSCASLPHRINDAAR